MDTHSRTELIASARNIAGETFDESVAMAGERGRLERIMDAELALALETIALSGFADEEAGIYSLIGPAIFYVDSQGFVGYDEYADADQAAAAFELIYA